MIMYKKLEEQEKQTFKALNANDFRINNITETMHKLYKEGALAVDKIWRDALKVYCQNNNIQYENVFHEILNIINS